MPRLPGTHLNDIDALLKTSPTCRNIIVFLLEHEHAMDTAEGIATWWVQCDPIAARAALDHLVASALVECHSFSAGTMYRLTRDASLRAWLMARPLDGDCKSHDRDAENGEPGQLPHSGLGKKSEDNDAKAGAE